jgi:hypothetical protein
MFKSHTFSRIFFSIGAGSFPKGHLFFKGEARNKLMFKPLKTMFTDSPEVFWIENFLV